jgi:hypothetical protein
VLLLGKWATLINYFVDVTILKIFMKMPPDELQFAFRRSFNEAFSVETIQYSVGWYDCKCMVLAVP